MKNTITIQGNKVDCEVINGNILVNGKPLVILYKQGLSGSKVYETEVWEGYHTNKKSDGTLSIKSYWNNSSRQIKDANAYFISVK